MATSPLLLCRHCWLRACRHLNVRACVNVFCSYRTLYGHIILQATFSTPFPHFNNTLSMDEGIMRKGKRGRESRCVRSPVFAWNPSKHVLLTKSVALLLMWQHVFSLTIQEQQIIKPPESTGRLLQTEFCLTSSAGAWFWPQIGQMFATLENIHGLFFITFTSFPQLCL